MLAPALQGQDTVWPAVLQAPPLPQARVGGAQGHLLSGLVGCPKHSCSQHRPEAKARRSGPWAWEPSVWSAVGQSRHWQLARDLLHWRLWILSGTFPSE